MGGMGRVGHLVVWDLLTEMRCKRNAFSPSDRCEAGHTFKLDGNNCGHSCNLLNKNFFPSSTSLSEKINFQNLKM